MVSKEKAIKIYTDFFEKLGGPGFFTYMVDFGEKESKTTNNADEIMLSLSGVFYSEYQKDNDIKYLEIHKIIRRVAHIMYRSIRKHDDSKKENKKFLRSVSG